MQKETQEETNVRLQFERDNYGVSSPFMTAAEESRLLNLKERAGDDRLNRIEAKLDSILGYLGAKP